MAKNKIKKPVAKRVKQNKTAKTTRKPRAKAIPVITTTESADFTLSAPIVSPPVPTVPQVEFTKIDYPSRLDYLDEQVVPPSKIKQVFNDISKWLDEASEKSFEKLKDFAFNHPLAFAISFCTVLTAVAVCVAAAMRYLRW